MSVIRRTVAQTWQQRLLQATSLQRNIVRGEEEALSMAHLSVGVRVVADCGLDTAKELARFSTTDQVISSTIGTCAGQQREYCGFSYNIVGPT